MTPAPRTSALTIIAVYWLMLIVGMASCIAMRSDSSIAAIWTGTVIGTVLGHALALVNTRTWFALLTILTTAAVVGPSAPGELSASTLWLAFMPAAACAYWSLGDRTTLVSFWFPAVIWMLSILDRAHANGMPDHTGIALLGVLALLFLLFLRVRETRRVALWSTVAAPATTLAVQRPPVMLKERPGFRLARTGWAVVASAAAFGATAWLAPRLWRNEQMAPEHEQRIAGEYTGYGVPCCPKLQDVETPRARVKEYFSIGRGHDEEMIEHATDSCRRCEAAVGALAATADDYRYRITTDPYAGVTPYYDNTPTPTPTTGTGTGTGYGYGYTPGTTTYADPPGTYQTPTAPPTGWTPPVHADEVIVPPTQTEPAYVAPPPVAPPPVEPHAYTPPPPPPVAVEQAPDPEPVVAAQPPTPPPAPPPAVSDGIAHEPSPARTRASSPMIGPSLLQWVGIILGAALLMQLFALALRPLRRLVTLRHLRQPFWQETVDQRISNAWQLALVGLRDAGWRSDAEESPRDLAKRVGIAGVEQCATILERARHGIGIDEGDLTTMTESADAAYRDARRRLGPVARAVSWLRWPLT